MLLIPQRYKFSSKSQQLEHRFVTVGVVADTTKVQIFKQITTYYSLGAIFMKLLLIPQRYKFSSKSQHFLSTSYQKNSCCWYHKGTNFQANHNPRWHLLTYQRLLLIPQRYKFSSKSQHRVKQYRIQLGCCWYHKGTNFQANHNMATLIYLTLRVVADTTKVQIFKQITTIRYQYRHDFRLLLIPQRYKFSSKSQL